MLVVEILNRQSHLEIEEETTEEFVTKITIGGHLFRFYAHQSSISYDPKDWECEFAEFTEHGQPRIDKTGHGHELHVFNFVKQSLQMFLQKYKPNKLFFESSKEDGNRTKLYTRLLSRFKIPGYEFVVGGNFPATDMFVIKKTNLDESISTPSYSDLIELANQFKKEFDGDKGKKEWGAPLHELEDENGTCSMVSNTFIDWLKDKGVHSKFITGEIATNRKWNDIPKEYGEGDGHTAVQVGTYVVDFTARQFDKKFPNPRIIEVSDFDEEWKKVS